ncbi:MAG TPA: 5-(carboxyamino)imidazole ribonucleotide synthase [Verrucomicrobiae bacterium]|nr:5-(carboxyamino)imidazole ribonucleotide synthase [Verrucomicrobiae bacterium]
MLALAGHNLGVRTVCLDPDPESSCGQVAAQVVGGFGDPTAIAQLAERVDRATFEFESVPSASAAWLADRRPLFPPVGALAAAQDRLDEKRFLEGIGIPVAPWARVDGPADLAPAIRRVGLPARLKARRLGYDGRGQSVVTRPGDAPGAWVAAGSAPAILERVVAFERELSVLAVADLHHRVACYPLVENRHHDGILRLSLAPAPGLSSALQSQGEALAQQIMAALGYVGVLAVECFQVAGTLVVNELAPRVHNSGHWTIEAAETSQFENHLRAGLGWPIGGTAMRGTAAMLNCIGAAIDPGRILRHPDCHLHWYGKAVRPGRKLGHVTVVAPDLATLAGRLGPLGEAVGVPLEVLERPLAG